MFKSLAWIVLQNTDSQDGCIASIYKINPPLDLKTSKFTRLCMRQFTLFLRFLPQATPFARERNKAVRFLRILTLKLQPTERCKHFESFQVHICDLGHEKGPQGGFWKAWKMSLYNTL